MMARMHRVKGAKDRFVPLPVETLQIIADYGPEYIRCFADAMPGNHRKALEAIVYCRTGFFGATVNR